MHSATAAPTTTDRQDATGEPVGLVGPDRPTRFLARVDAHLAGLAPREKLSFLDVQLSAWTRAYAKFVSCSEGDFDAPTSPDQVDASDYLLTITGLAARRCQTVDEIEALQKRFGARG